MKVKCAGSYKFNGIYGLNNTYVLQMSNNIVKKNYLYVLYEPFSHFIAYSYQIHDYTKEVILFADFMYLLA